MDLNARLRALEENAYFQEKFVQELSHEVYEKDERISSLEKELARVKENLILLEEHVLGKFQATVPPHYDHF